MPLKLAVVIASAGRAAELARWTDHVARQSIQPAVLIFSITKADDLPANFDRTRAMVIIGPAGLPIQRNRALDILDDDVDIVCFFDDDYVPSAFCLEGICDFFKANAVATGVTGKLLADGIHGPGLEYEVARSIVELHDSNIASARPKIMAIDKRVGLYGCNMAFRMTSIGKERFDERLPLYGWQEDVDFAVRVSRGGPVFGTNAFAGVHQGTKRGRSSGKRFGYSQIANPFYLIRKGTLPPLFALRLATKNVIANHIKSVRPEPWIDRRGRLRGNWIAFVDLLRGSIQPERILEL